MITCSACGTQNPPTAEYCAKCARRLDVATSQKIAQVRTTSVATQTTGIRWSTVAVTAGSAAVLLIVIVLVLVFVIH